MKTKILTEDFLREHRNVLERFAQWYKDTNKAETTQVTLAYFFEMGFELQLGFYLEWLATNGVYLIKHNDPINNHLVLRLEYTKDPNMDFKYFDLQDVDTEHFKNNPIDAYELLIAQFIYKLNFPF